MSLVWGNVWESLHSVRTSVKRPSVLVATMASMAAVTSSSGAACHLFPLATSVRSEI